MSDIASLVDPETAIASGAENVGSVGGSFPTGFDTSWLDVPSFTTAGGTPLLTMPQSVTPTGGGNLFDSLTNLVAQVYRGENAMAATKGAVQVAQAQNRVQAQQAVPNMLLIGGGVLAAVLLVGTLKK